MSSGASLTALPRLRLPPPTSRPLTRVPLREPTSVKAQARSAASQRAMACVPETSPSSGRLSPQAELRPTVSSEAPLLEVTEFPAAGPASTSRRRRRGAVALGGGGRSRAAAAAAAAAADEEEKEEAVERRGGRG